MKGLQNITGIEINPKFVGAFFTERTDDKLRVFCFLTNGATSQFEMSADENLDNLQRFHAKLNMDETCSSVIVDEIVQGRVYVRSEEGHWLYTFLSTPGNVLPPLNAGICNLPWEYCWRSQSADVLEYGKLGDPVHCFAIRTQINESDALRLVKDSNAFTNPVCIRKKKKSKWLNLKIVSALALLGILAGAASIYAVKQNRPEKLNPSTTVFESKDASFYLLCSHQISGPYSAKVIANMKAGGLLNAETMCRPDKSTEWVSLATLFPSQPTK